MQQKQRSPSHLARFQLGALAIGLALLTLVGLVTIAGGWSSSTVEWEDPTAVRASRAMADRLVMTDTSSAFRAGSLNRVKLVEETGNPIRIELGDDRERAFPREGDWLSPEVVTEAPFTDLLPSWNVQTPDETGVRFDVRVRDAATGQWTDWLYIGSWGKILAGLNRKIESGNATIDIDELKLSAPADAYQIRGRLYSFSFDPKIVPSVRRVAVCYSGEASAFAGTERPAVDVTLDRAGVETLDWRRDLNVPYRPQGDSPPPLRSQICSPTSTSMVMQYWGVDRPTVENAMAIYDAEYDLFGNWNRAVQRAAECGLDGWLIRLRNWEQVKPYIAAGIPLVATISFRKGEFPSALYDSTPGHLIVIRGFTKDGDVIVNDPAVRDKGNGVIYKADELGPAWFVNKGGATYVIEKPQ